MILTVLIVAAAAVGGLLVYAWTTPDTMIVQRSTAVNAPPARIFPLINDFREWSKWSPWEDLDPALQRTYSGAASGPGAVYDWSGNRQAGQGRMEIMDTTPPANVSIKLDFIKPFEGHQRRCDLDGAVRRRDRRDLADDWAPPVSHEGHGRLHELGQDGRPRLRARPRELKKNR